MIMALKREIEVHARSTVTLTRGLLRLAKSAKLIGLGRCLAGEWSG